MGTGADMMSERKWCEHMAEGWIDNCPDCRIAALEAQVKSIADDYLELKRLRKGEALNHLGKTKRIEKLEAKLDEERKLANDRLRELLVKVGAQKERIAELEAEIVQLHNPHTGEECECDVCQRSGVKDDE
jgi:hypothetical protein